MNSTLLALLRNPETPTFLLREACMDATLHTVWVVQYNYGSYSDYNEVHIGAFLDKEQAERWMATVSAEYAEKRKWFKETDDFGTGKEYEEVRQLKYNGKAKLESCPDVDFAEFYDYEFRIITIPLRVEE